METSLQSTLSSAETQPSAPAESRENRGPVPAGNTATGTLKLIALAFMIIDHLGAVVFPRIPEMRILGRIAFPIYCWCLIVGFHYTRSVPKYLGRILLTGIISQPLYAYVMDHMGASENLWQNLFLSKPNIFLTLFLGLAAVWAIREKKFFSQIWGPLLAIALATICSVDYGWRGVLFIMLLYAARGSRASIAAVMIAFFLYWGTGYSLTASLFGIPLDYGKLPGWIYQPLSAFLRMETYGLMSLPFILIPFRKNIKLPAWLTYGIYPAHLLIVLAVKLIVK
ncbi:MAG: hypothetical protein IJ153_08935 [Clostridia bacterium]|nr:hypothetical protein [Clostridia bacterium]